MATETERANETTVKKTITLLGYIKEKYGANSREVADTLDDETDYYNKKDRVTEKRYLVSDGKKMRIKDDDFWESLRNKNTGDVDIQVEEKTERVFKCQPNAFARSVGTEIFKGLDLDLPIGLKAHSALLKVKNHDDEQELRFYKYFSDKRMVKHEDKRSPDDETPFVDDETEYPCLRFKVKITSSTSERVEMLTEEVVEPFYREMASLEYVSRVRMLDCEITTEEKGACFRV